MALRAPSDIGRLGCTGQERELLQAVRRIRSDIPIVLCTGFSHVIDAEKARALGHVTFLMKPVDERELVDILQRR